MPIYEYICGKCGKRFDKRQSFDDKPVALCPSCNGDSKRLISCVPVIFKGNGFYVTDYKKENACVTNTTADKEPAAAVTSDTKKEATPAASTESKSPESRKAESKTQESKKDSKAAS